MKMCFNQITTERYKKKDFSAKLKYQHQLFQEALICCCTWRMVFSIFALAFAASSANIYLVSSATYAELLAL